MRRTQKRTQKKHKGGYYSMSGAIAPGAALWTRQSEMGDYAISNRGNNAMYGRGRSKKSRKQKTRKGGARYGAVSASYQGTGSRGMADYVATNTKYPPFGPAKEGAFNNAASQPGSFVKAV